MSTLLLITSKDITHVLSKFNFAFNLQFKTELESEQTNHFSTLASSFYNYSTTSAEVYNVEYIKPSQIKILVTKDSDYYYTSSFHINSNPDKIINERNQKIKTFYKQFLLFYQNIINKRYSIKTKKDFVDIMLKNTACQKSVSFLQFLKHLWIVMSSKDLLSYEQKINELIERVELSFNNISKRNKSMYDFELHQAVYDGNLRMISKIIGNNNNNTYNSKQSFIYCDINEIDPNGNTPLLLALKRNNIDVVKVLCDHNADIKLKSYEGGITPLEYALKRKMTKMLKIFVNSKKNKVFTEWNENKHMIFDLITNIPNFVMELRLNFDSHLLNLFSSLTANDCYKISKLNGDMRIDMNVNSNNEFKGKSSILLKQQDKTIYKIEHNNKNTYDYIEKILSDNDEEKKVAKLLKEGVIHTKVYMDNLSLQDYNQTKEILGYQCNMFKVTGSMFMEKEIVKDNINNINEDNDLNGEKLYNKRTFEDYFFAGIEKKQFYLKNILMNTNKRNTMKKKLTNKTISYKTLSTTTEVDIIQGQYIDNDNRYLSTESSENKNKTKLKKKPIDISVWLSKDFPITLQHFLPLIHILSFASNDFSQLENTIAQKLLPFQSFPLKISFPLGMSFHALLSIVSFNFESPSPSTFNIDYLDSQQQGTSSLTEPLTGIIGDTNYYNMNTQIDNFYTDYYKEKGLLTKNGKMNQLIDSVEYSDEESIIHIREFPTKSNCKSPSPPPTTNQFSQCQTFVSTQSSKNKEIPNNEFDFSKLYKIPKAPSKRRKRIHTHDLERQNTIKCVFQLKLPKEITQNNQLIKKKQDNNSFISSYMAAGYNSHNTNVNNDNKHNSFTSKTNNTIVNSKKNVKKSLTERKNLNINAVNQTTNTNTNSNLNTEQNCLIF